MLLHKLPQLTGPANWSIIRLTGLSRATSREPLMALYAGNAANLSYLRGLLFHSADMETLARPATVWTMTKRLLRHATTAQVLLAELPPLWAALTPLPGTLRVPAWVRHELDLRDRASGRWLLPRHVEREADRQIRRHAYTLRFSTDEADFRSFFHDMYRPYVQLRFGDGALVMEEEQFMARCRQQSLALLQSQGRPVAAVLLKRQGKAMRLGWYGCLGAPLPGASESLDVLCIRHAYRAGTRRIVFGDSRPSLTDGVARYKMRFGARICATTFPQASLAIHAPTWTPELTECINKEQLITIRRGQPLAISIDSRHSQNPVRHEPLTHRAPRRNPG